MKVCRTDLGLPGLRGFFVLPGPLRKVENVLHTYTVLDFIGESPYTRRVTGVSPCFEGECRDSDGICGKVGHGRDDVKGKVSDGVGGALPCLAASSHLHRCLVVLAFSLTSHRPSGILIA